MYLQIMLKDGWKDVLGNPVTPRKLARRSHPNGSPLTMHADKKKQNASREK